MKQAAYNLSSNFVEELKKRIQLLVDATTPETIFGSLFQDLALLPSKEIISRIIDAAVWTSFATDEGHPVKISIILNPTEESFETFIFDKPIPFDVKNLAKLGAALEKPRADVCIWPGENDELTIWGFKTRSNNTLIGNLCVEAIGPGRVLITFGGQSLAALIGNEAVFVNHSHLMSQIATKLSSPADQQDIKMLRFMRYRSLLNIARKMRDHQRGGTLLAVTDTGNWRQSIATPIPYTGGANFLESDYDIVKKPSLIATVTDLFGAMIKNKTIKERENLRRLGDQVEQQCRHIASLTAVDGALAMSFDRFVYCFGAKIIPAENQTPPTNIQLYKPVEGDDGTRVNLIDLGGTRHQSAALFAHAQPDSIAIVVSQDGDVTFFNSDPQTGNLMAIQQAELAVIPEDLGALLWSYTHFAEMDLT